MRIDQLQRAIFFEKDVLRLIHNSHPAPADLINDSKLTAKHGSRRESVAQHERRPVAWTIARVIRVRVLTLWTRLHGWLVCGDYKWCTAKMLSFRRFLGLTEVARC